MTFRNLLLACCLTLLYGELYGQINDAGIPDSLLTKNYSYFIQKLESDQYSLDTAKIYSAAYLAKAKSEYNWKEITNAYKSILHQSDEKLQLVYADSMIYAARHTASKQLIASGFLTKGIVYNNLKEQSNALDNFLIANELLAKEKNQYLSYKVKFNIAKVKYYLGFYSEALPLFKECVSYFESEDDMAYLVSLHHLGLCYLKTGKFEMCSATNDLGIREAFRIELPEAVAHFVHSEGINQYYKKNYGTAILKLQQSLPGIVAAKDVANETLAYFYIGKSFFGLYQYDKGVPYLQKVDEAFSRKHFIQPDLRENYELLIDYYKSKNDLRNRLFYVDRLLMADKVLRKNYSYLSGKIYKEYNTQELLQSKREIEEALRQEKHRNIVAIGIIILLLFLVFYLTFKYFENRFYKKKYKEYIVQKTKPKENNRTIFCSANLGISQEVVDQILINLEKFEQNNIFLEKDLKQERLAVIFESNPKYIAKIIKHYRGKKSNDYINDLRIDYIIDLLKKEKRYRKYTNKALGEEIGFSTTQHFTRAFLAKTGIAASFFIKQLINDLDSDASQK